MRNVFTIFKNDLRALYKHFFAFLIILAILVLPALYAWFNIYAYWDPYSKTNDVKIAVVCDDQDYMDEDGKIINIGKELVKELKADEHFGFEFLDDADQAVEDVYSGDYYAAVIIGPDFTYNMYNFLKTDMFSPTINFYQNEKTNAIAVKIVEAAGDTVKQYVNEKYIEAIVETLFGKLNDFSSDVQGNSAVETLKNTLAKINNNLISYSKTIDSFIGANNSLIGTLKNTNSTLEYSIYLLGNERINISKQISYIESSQGDLALINEEVNNMLLGLQDSVQEAIYKLDRLYQGSTDDEDDVQSTLAELERQYQELIDYITHSGLTGPEIEDALSALNTLKDKISAIRTAIGLNNEDANLSAAEEIKSGYEDIAVPAVYSAVTGYDYTDLTKPASSQQSMDTMMSFMADDADQRISNIQENINIAKTTKDPSVRTEALTAAKKDADIVDQEVSALGTAFEAVETASGINNTTSKATYKAADSAQSAGDIIEDILNGNRDIDLIRDLQLVSDALGTTRVTLTEIVYPAIDTLLENLQDSLGDVSSIVLDLSNVIGKVTPIVSELGNTFGAVNKALIQVKELVDNYITRINDVIGILNGDTENTSVQQVLDFFNVDPKSIGEFFASPVSIKSECVYPVESYGTAMAPFYTMLAIWVGCIIINAIMKVDTPVELAGASERQKFFGRYLIFLLLSEIQTMIIMLGDLLILGVECVHPGLFLLSGVVTSLVCSMIAYSLAVAFGNIGKALVVVIMIIQIAGSGGSYPIELLPDFFQQVYLFFPFPYAINAMREAIAGLYQNSYLIYLLQLMIFFAAGLFIGLVVKRSFDGINKYMNEQLEKTEMM